MGGPGASLRERLSGRVGGEFLKDPPSGALTAAVGDSRIVKLRKKRAVEQYKRGRSPYGEDSQPRDSRGRFRDVLARLKVDLGESELNQVVDKVEDAEKAEQRKDYGKASDAATDVVQMIDRLEEGALNADQLKNIKDAGRELGKAIAYLPMPQGMQNEKLRYSDLPPTTQQLLQGMKDRIEEKLEPDKAAELLAVLNSFLSGTVQLSSDDIQAQLARLLTYLID